MTIEQQFVTPEGTIFTYNAPFANAALRRRCSHRAIERYGYDECAAAPVERHEPASTQLVVILELAGPLEVGAPENAVCHPSGFVAGLIDRPTRTWHGGRQAGIQINLDALSASQLLGMPLASLGDGVHAIDDVLDAADRTLLPQLRSTEDWATRLALVDGWLERRLGNDVDAHRDVAGIVHALERLDQTHGGLRIAALAAELGWSERRLQRTFERNIGMAPKRYAQIVRFAALRTAMRSGRVKNLSDAAARFGYADQAHLSREVQRLAGSTPTALLRSGVPLRDDH